MSARAARRRAERAEAKAEQAVVSGPPSRPAIVPRSMRRIAPARGAMGGQRASAVLARDLGW